MMLSLLDVGTAMGPIRPRTPGAPGRGAGVLGGPETAGAEVVVLRVSVKRRAWFVCLGSEAPVSLLSAAAAATGDGRENTSEN